MYTLVNFTAIADCGDLAVDRRYDIGCDVMDVERVTAESLMLTYRARGNKFEKQNIIRFSLLVPELQCLFERHVRHLLDKDEFSTQALYAPLWDNMYVSASFLADIVAADKKLLPYNCRSEIKAVTIDGKRYLIKGSANPVVYGNAPPAFIPEGFRKRSKEPKKRKRGRETEKEQEGGRKTKKTKVASINLTEEGKDVVVYAPIVVFSRIFTVNLYIHACIGDWSDR